MKFSHYIVDKSTSALERILSQGYSYAFVFIEHLIARRQTSQESKGSKDLSAVQTPSPMSSSAVRFTVLCLTYWLAWLLVASVSFASLLDPNSALLYYIILTALMFFTGLVGMCSFTVSSPEWDVANAMTHSLPLHALALMAETSQLAVVAVFLSALPAVLLAARVFLVWTVAKLIAQNLPTL